MLRIATNVMGLNTHRNLNVVSSKAEKVSEKLSSGLKINRAADDAAGLAISEKMRNQIKGLNQANRNVQDGVSLIQTAEGGMSEISEMIKRQRELTIQAMNDTNTSEDRQKIQGEIDQLTKEITATAEKTEFNGLPLLNIEKNAFSNINLTFDPNNGIPRLQGDIAANSTGKLATIDCQSLSGDGFYLTTWFSSPQIDDLVFGMISPKGDEFNFTSDNVGTILNTIYGDISINKLGSNSFVLDFTNVTSDTLGKWTYVVNNTSSSNASFDLGTNNRVTANSRGLELYPYTDSPLYIQAGANENQGMYVDRYDCRAKSLGIDPIIIDPITEAEKSLVKLDNAVETINDYRANAGAQQNRLEHTELSLGVSSENLEAANSRIRDTDMAKEMMEYTKSNILSQAGMSMLSQANQQPQNVLSIIK